MKRYGKVRSTVRPGNKEVDDYSVWINSNIVEVSEDEFEGFEFEQIRYTKDEYITLIDSRTEELSGVVDELIVLALEVL